MYSKKWMKKEKKGSAEDQRTKKRYAGPGRRERDYGGSRSWRSHFQRLFLTLTRTTLMLGLLGLLLSLQVLKSKFKI
jgi:hypothetical protein